MLTEDFCSFEVAKLLKEKGFDELCIFKYNSEGVRMKAGVAIDEWQNSELDDDECSCVSHQMAMKWLREVHKLAFIISPQWAEGDMRNPCRWYWEIRGLEDIDLDVYSNPLCNTYEEAVEAACIYSLENLI